MSDKTAIEWTDATWTPIRARYHEIQDDGSGKERIGWHCEHVSEGCRHCYAETINRRLGTGLDFKPGHLYRAEREGYHNGEVKLFLDEKMLLAPLRWKKPRMIFVCSMTDLFADFVPDEWIDKIFAVMALCPQHTFQVLTKRAGRMREYFNGPYKDGNGVCARIADATWSIAPSRADLPDPPVFIEVPVGPRLPSGLPEFGFRRMMHPKAWPLPNVWLGISAERQQEWDERKEHLRNTPAAVRFASFEPLLGPIIEPRPMSDFIQWAIVGGESGPNARPMHPDWARSLRDQCAAAGVDYFFKQWGQWAPTGSFAASEIKIAEGHVGSISCDSSTRLAGHGWDLPAEIMKRCSKKSAGRLLDGVEHNAMPVRP